MSKSKGFMKSGFGLLMWSTVVLAQTPSRWQDFMVQTPHYQFAWVAPQDTVEETDEAYEDEYVDLKSPKKAFVLSALIPGSGQIYNQSWLKAGAFLAIEAASWIFYSHYTQKGQDIDAEFKAYADAHWSENEYWDYIARRSGQDRSDLEALRTWEKNNYSHSLHRVKDQQYYEMIGKYDQFNAGWDDSEVGLWDNGFSTALRSQNRLAYDDRRDDSNRAFKNATSMATIAIINHLVSGFDAAWSSHRFNQSQLEASLHLTPRYWDHRSCTALTLDLRW
ncbi:MAG TPA: DUF5683 domain-containing protein [bacterium]|nr:DUF5683 domain-containing protein [bacterium]